MGANVEADRLETTEKANGDGSGKCSEKCWDFGWVLEYKDRIW